MEKLAEYLKLIVSGLVTKPDEVIVDYREDEQGVLLTLKVGEGDAGKVIGKKGSVAEALRVIVRSSGYVDGMRVSIKIDAPENKFGSNK
jgi:hypothetical protein